MKAILYAVAFMIGLFSGIIALYGQWLLYKHVKATDLMWFIWWLGALTWLPMIILGEVIKSIAKRTD